MRAHPVRAGSAVVAGLLLVPIGGATVAAVPDGAVPDVVTAPGSAPAPEGLGPATAPAATVPDGVEIVSLEVRAATTPTVQPWHTSGRYAVTVTVLDVIGLDSGGQDHPGMTDEVHLAWVLGGGATVAFAPDADGSVRIDGLREGVNRVGVQATYVNVGGSGLNASANYVADVRVEDRATTVASVREAAAPPGAPTEAGETLQVTAPPGSFGPGEQVTLVVVGTDGEIVGTSPTVAGPDGAAGGVYRVPVGATPGELLLYLEGSAGPGAAVRAQVAGPPAVVDVPGAGEPGAAGGAAGAETGGTGEAGTSPDAAPSAAPAPAPVPSVEPAGGRDGDALAATGSGPATALTVAGLLLAGGAALLRLSRRRV